MKSVVKVTMYGAMERAIRVHGRIIKCMEKGSCGGQMAKSTKVILKKIKGMVRGCLNGKTEENMKANGPKENSMELVYIEM